MVFLLLAGISVLLAVLQLRGRRSEDPQLIRVALLRGGTAFLASWLVQAGISSLAKNSTGLSLSLSYSAQAGISALLSLVLWSALAPLAFYRLARRDLFFIVPFGTLSILLAAATGVEPLTAALVASPALFRVRWRREIASGTLGLVGLFGFLFILLSFISPRIQLAEVGVHHPLAGLERYADWVRGLVAVHILAALPRLLWGISLPIRNVRRRLLVSHLMTGVVPLALVVVFWGLSTYFSVNGERARIASRFLGEVSKDLGMSLEAALATPEEAESRLVHWAQLESALYPGLRVWLTHPEEKELLRAFGDPLHGEDGLAQWSDTLPPDAVVLLGGRAYVGAHRTVVRPGPAIRTAAVLVPAATVLGASFQSRLDAEVFLETRWSLIPVGGGRAVGVADIDSVETQESLLRARERRAAPGVAVVSAIEWRGGQWQRRTVLVWARVGFLSSIRGLARNLQENPFKNPFDLMPLVFLGVVAVLFVLVEVLTLGMVSSMGGSILRALSALRQGTARLRSGNFRYRIPVEGHDELWEVAHSFNEMAADLDKARDLEIEQDRIEGELNLARQIQSRLLPGEAPVVPQTEVAGLYAPARHVGGDYYDYIRLSRDRIALIVADVSGKGVPAALLMSSFRAALLSQNLEDRGPAQIMGRLNSFLHRSIEPGRFVTAFLGVLDPHSGRFSYSNAGHNPPIVFAPGGEISTMTKGGLILGLFGDSSYEEEEVQLLPGSLVALYTDGVTEAVSDDEEFWGEERMLEILQHSPGVPCRKILHEILSEVRAFAGAAGPSDDITMVLARWQGAGEGPGRSG